MHVVGREHPTEWCRTAWADADTGHGSVLLLTGDAGIGKSTLVQQLADHVAPTGAVIRWGAAWEGTPSPLGPWLDVLRSPGDDPCAALGEQLSRATADVLELRDRGDQFAAITAVLADASRLAPQLVVLEDLHWADTASLLVLRAVASGIAALRMLVVATFRRDEVPTVSPLLDLGGRTNVFGLEGLGRDAVGQLLENLTGSRLTAEVVDEVVVRSSGNPLFVSHLGRLLATGGELSAPDSLVQVLRRRLTRLPAECFDTLGAVAVLGREATLPALASVTGVDEPTLLAHLDEAAAARLLAHTPATDRWEFTHDLVRQTRLDLLGAGARADLHARAFRALSGRADVPLTALAQHALNARLKTDAVVEVVLAAADEAFAGLALEEAGALYTQALARTAQHDQRGRALLGCGAVALRMGDERTAVQHFAEAADLARQAPDHDLLARAALGLGAGLDGFEVRVSEPQQVQLLREAAAALPVHAPLRPLVLARLSTALTMSAAEAERLELAREAVTLAQEQGDDLALAAALASRCDALSGPDHVTERLRDASAIVRLGLSLRAPRTELLGRRLLVKAHAEALDIRRLDSEIAAYARTSTLLGDPFYEWYVPLWRATRAMNAGQWSAARELRDEALSLGTVAGSLNAQVLVEVSALVSYLDQPDLAALGTVMSSSSVLPDLAMTNGIPMLVYMDHLLGQPGVEGRLRDVLADLDSFPRDAEWLPMMAAVADLVTLLDLRDLAPGVLELLSPYAGMGFVEGIAAGHRGPVDRALAGLTGTLRDGRATTEHLARARSLAAALGTAEQERVEATARLAQDRLGRPTDDDATLRREADLWHCTFRGTTVTLRHAKGMADLATLLERRGGAVHVTELEPGAVVAGSTGPLLDAQATRSYKQRLRELDDDLDVAGSHHDQARVALLTAERDALVHELTAAFGLGGRARSSGPDPHERLRKAVTARLRASVARLGELHPALGRHLDVSVRTGSVCSYQPDQETVWRVER